jgi:hypothetical protein
MGPQANFGQAQKLPTFFDKSPTELPARSHNTMDVGSKSDAEILETARGEIGKNLVSTFLIQAVQSGQH